MLQLTSHHRLLLAVHPVDFRKGILGLGALCRQGLEENPMSGTVYIFVNRRYTALKFLVYDNKGFWLYLKRFSSGKLPWWPTGKEKSLSLNLISVQILLSQGHPLTVKTPPAWHPLRSS